MAEASKAIAEIADLNFSVDFIRQIARAKRFACRVRATAARLSQSESVQVYSSRGLRAFGGTHRRPNGKGALPHRTCYIAAMTKLLEHAVRQVEQLPEGEQDAAAAALLDYVKHMRELRLSDEQVAEVRRRIANPHRKLISHEEARERISRLGS
jgi:hypothetical protein